MGSAEESLVAALRAADATVSTAESLTGGRVAARITSVPGSSAVFTGGVVSYQTRVKVQLLGVSEELIATHGVVSSACARAMAVGVRELLGTTYGVSTTGVAGPERQEGQPVGTVYIAVAGPGDVRVRALVLAGDRMTIQDASVEAAVSELAAMIGSAGHAPEDSRLG